ncbi:c-type cytochrome [Billgrantia lactosivorans]|uniref:c-type cytochrome n=1 Tax=Billgrantia lactosivorans TaxID=2185141 RepID=UPI000DAC0769|nr:c-type cytochrome [Halomonas lactosivorans]
MKRRDTSDNHVSRVDPQFDPWEPNRPIPLFVIALVIALAIWGALTYLSEVGQHEATGPATVQQGEPSASPGAVAATGLDNARPEILDLAFTGKDNMWSCASCHGKSGEGSSSTPRLSGQLGDYLYKQLLDFRSGARANAHMKLVAQALTQEEMRELADYYAQIRLPSQVRPQLGGDLERGRQLVQSGDWKRDVPACLQCHGDSGQGVQPHFPSLAGQQPEYLFTQLAQWHTGVRGNSPQRLMDRISQAMTPEDMRDVADYLATLPLVEPAQAR